MDCIFGSTEFQKFRCINLIGEGCYIRNISCSLQPFIFAKLAFDSGRWLEMIKYFIVADVRINFAPMTLAV